jgi:glycosyltransferase involved in cell wall biosynthesis
MTRPVMAMVCAFPPPVHGAALVSERMRKRFVLEGFRIVSINTSPQSLRRSLKYYVARFRALCGVWRLISLGPSDIIYCYVNARWGAVIDLIVALIARAVGAELWLHHHSFYYLKKSFLLHTATFALNRRRTHHIVLCECMKKRIVETYRIQADRIRILSNINFVEPANINFASVAHECNSIGFLSNISEEKGISEFLKLCDRMQNVPVNFEIAGPILDDTYDWIRDLEIMSNQKIRWVGALDEFEKTRFLARIDLLVFPTHYRNEAEPLVIYEAMAAGVVVVAYDRGCIREMMEAPHVVAANFDELERTVRSLLIQRPSRAEVCEKYRQRRNRYRSHMSILEMA